MIVQLPYPHKALWPNGRAHWGAKAKQVKDHRTWAYMATKAALPTCYRHNGSRIPVRLVVSAKPKGPVPDKDNCLAASKAYLDGIAEALGVNDNLFDPQPVHFSGRQSSFIIQIGD